MHAARQHQRPTHVPGSSNCKYTVQATPHKEFRRTVAQGGSGADRASRASKGASAKARIGSGQTHSVSSPAGSEDPACASRTFEMLMSWTRLYSAAGSMAAAPSSSPALALPCSAAAAVEPGAGRFTPRMIAPCAVSGLGGQQPQP